MSAVAHHPDFRALLISFVIQSLGVGLLLAGVAYVAEDLLHKKAASSLLFAAFVGPALLVTPLWAKYAHRRGKLSGFRVATVVMTAGMLLLFVGLPNLHALVYLAAAVVGIGYAGGQILSLAMFADAAGFDPSGRDENRVGVFSGVWTAGETLGLALGPAVFGLVLAFGGYLSSTAGKTVEQPDSALWAIRLGFTLLPAALVLISLIPLRAYRLDEKLAHRATITS